METKKCTSRSCTNVSFSWNVNKLTFVCMKHWKHSSCKACAPPRRRLVSASDTEIMFKNDSPSSVVVTGMWQKAATTWKSCSTSVCDNPDQKVTDFKHWQEAWSFDSYIFVPECVTPRHGCFMVIFLIDHKTTDQTQGMQRLPTADGSTTAVRSVMD